MASGNDYTKHAAAKEFVFRPNVTCLVDPEGKKGIRPFIEGPAILAMKVNFINLPPVGKGRPTKVAMWARRYADGEAANATGTADLAVPQTKDPAFRAVWTYLTYIERADDPVTFHLHHDAGGPLTANLAQVQVIAMEKYRP